jgi:hypothetical protein
MLLALPVNVLFMRIMAVGKFKKLDRNVEKPESKIDKD